MGRNFDIIKVGKTKYKYVTEFLAGGKTTIYSARVVGNGKGIGKRKTFHSLKEAAIYVDTQLILAGKKPVNILKKV